MNGNANIERCARRWGAGFGVAAAGMVAAMLGMADAPAHADGGGFTDTFLGPEDYLLTFDNSLLGGATVPAQFQSSLAEQTQILANAMDALNNAEAVQGPTGAAEWLFSGADQQFNGASTAFYYAILPFVGDPSAHTESDLFLPDLELIGASSDLTFVDDLAPLFGLVGTDVTGAAAELATSFDPADLFCL